ncbi:PAP2 superfamily protein [Haloactinopolyspora alba]|uniref:PAP2 superfamily protein n=1 Tax=Haloactinopolyspora alba TaxID=648780 RepID=A0A2P8E7G1_9ACTN|nr:phosphatase PAP2 family protein [Haloactinopolyspora alba]PSL05358.1 PAP2 superfamily protein [Haloactinopolyspora alba]
MATTSTTAGPAEVTPAPDRPPVRSRPRQLLSYFRTPRRPRFFVELAIMAIGYGIYSLIRNAVPDQEVEAITRSMNLWQLEQSLNIDFELWLNHTVNAIDWLTVSMNYFYAIMHFVVTGAVLVWLFWRHPGRYRASRTVLAFTTGLALVGYFVYPLAPPRLLPDGGFFDTVAIHQTWGSMASGDLQSLSNQYAAMPSMHAGWSLWCGIAIIMFTRHRWLRLLGLLYPAATLIVITATANHYVFDAVGGWLTLALGFALQRVLHGRPVHAFQRDVVAVT